MTDALRSAFREALADAGTGWSVGTFGAIAEFHQDAGEPVPVDEPDRLERATSRGAIRIDPDVVREITPVAYETVSPRRHRWGQGIALCLPPERAARSRRAVLTELGPDEDAVRPEDREAVLFDMGLDLPQIDFCVRTSDPDLLAALRANEGRSVFSPDCDAMSHVLRRHPHRVAISSLGRAEVYQMIGGSDTGGVSPAGPHTHVLPQLLKSGRTHSANVPVPDGLVPCAGLHPPSPVFDSMGRDTEFRPDPYTRFQRWLAEYGAPGYVRTKHLVRQAVIDGVAPDDFPMPRDRLGRTALRNTLRQLARIAEHEADPALSARAARWLAECEPKGDGEVEDEDEMQGHE